MITNTISNQLQHISWGMIGCGNVTEVKSGPAFNKISNSSLQAVMGRDAAKVADYATRHHVPAYYTDADDLINDKAVNAIYIATPPKFHEEYVLKALQVGKPVYVEKPVTTSIVACERIIAAAEQYNTKLVVAHYRRALPVFLAVKDFLKEDKIGEVRLVRISCLQPYKSSLIAATEDNWRINPDIAGAGLFYDIGPHQIDMMLYLFGEAINYKGLSINQSGFYTPEDLVTGLIQFKNNILFTGIWGFTMPEHHREESCEIIGEKGNIKFTFYGKEFHCTSNGKTEIFSFPLPDNIQQPIIEKVVNYFLDKEENPCTAKEALDGLKIMNSFVY